MRGEMPDGEKRGILVIACDLGDLAQLALERITVDLDSIPEADPYHGLRVVVTGPAGGEWLLREAVSARDDGIPVQYRRGSMSPDGRVAPDVEPDE